MALDPHSEPPDLAAPAEYRRDHPDEHPTDWGWHGEWGRAARVAGWVVTAILLLMITTTHYNFSGGEWLILFATALVLVLSWDHRRRTNTYRERAKKRQVPVGLSVFLIVIGLILEFAPRGSDRALALNVIAAAIGIVGALGLAQRVIGAVVRRLRPRRPVGAVATTSPRRASGHRRG